MLLLTLLFSGTIGYILLEGWSWQDALFMTIITLSTVGYGEVKPLTDAGKLFSIVLILLGVGSATYSFGFVVDYVVAGELRGILRRQRMARAIDKLENHYVICGYGRVGRQAVEGLRANNFDIVVVDVDPTVTNELDSVNIKSVIGNATDDDVLIQAGIARARGLCTCLPNDATNVFVILSARTLNSSLYIISRGNVQESEPKLRMAGANQVINPYLITGHRMASHLLHPGVIEFLDVIMRQGDLELRIEELTIGKESTMNSKTLAECNVRQNTGVNILAVRRPNGQLIIDLGAQFYLGAGDALIALGTLTQLARLAQQAGDEHVSLHFGE